jgi:hypothetical protein
VAPATIRSPTVMLAFEAAVVDRSKVPATIVPAVDKLPPAAESTTFRVPVPTLPDRTVDAVSLIAMIPDVAVMFMAPAVVLLRLTPPVPLEIVSTLVPMLVAAVWLMVPVPSAVRVVVPAMFVLPRVRLPFVPA